MTRITNLKYKLRTLYYKRKLQSNKEKFIPASKGCAKNCLIDLVEKDNCCKSARQCCLFCIEECPIKEVYGKFLDKYQNVYCL